MVMKPSVYELASLLLTGAICFAVFCYVGGCIDKQEICKVKPLTAQDLNEKGLDREAIVNP